MFFAVYMASCGLAAAGNFTIVYPLDYARTRLSSDVGSETKPSTVCSFVLRRRLLAPRASFPFTLFSACPSEESSRTVASSSVPSTPSRAPTRGSTTPACLVRLHVCDGTDSHHLGAGIPIVSGEYSGFYTLSSLIFLPSRRFGHGRRRVDLLRVHRSNIYQLFGVGALAHRRLRPFRGFVREVPLALLALHLSAREGCPGHCDTLTGWTFFYQLAARISNGINSWFLAC